MSSERIDRLEERIAWLERHVGEQDKVMLELTEVNARLKVQLLAILDRVGSLPPVADSASQGDRTDERPPHY